MCEYACSCTAFSTAKLGDTPDFFSLTSRKLIFGASERGIPHKYSVCVVLLMFSTTTAVLSRTYGLVRSIVRRRLAWWKSCGIDAFTEEEYRTRRKRRRERGEIEDIVLVRDIFVLE